MTREQYRVFVWKKAMEDARTETTLLVPRIQDGEEEEKYLAKVNSYLRDKLETFRWAYEEYMTAKNLAIAETLKQKEDEQ